MTSNLNADTLSSSRRYAVLKNQRSSEQNHTTRSHIIQKYHTDELKSASSSVIYESSHVEPQSARETSRNMNSANEPQNSKYNYESLVKEWSHNNTDKLSEGKKEQVRKKIENLGALLDKIPLKHNVENTLGDIKGKASLLNTNFNASVEVGKTIHDKYQGIQQLVKGGEFTKLSRKSTKLVKRFVFYSETLEAICWRDPKSKVPKTKQMIYLTDILKVNESFRNSVIGRKSTNLKIDENLFFSIETSQRTFDFLAPSLETKALWVRTINLLVLVAKGRRKEGSSGKLYENELIEENRYENVAREFNGNLRNIHKEIEDVKRLCDSNNKKLRKNFLQLAEEAIDKEVQQIYKLEKEMKVLDGELKEEKNKNENLTIENLSVTKNLEASNLKGRQLVAQLRSYNTDKNRIMGYIREFQKKLLNCVEFMSMLDFEVSEKDGEQVVSTNGIGEGACLNEDFSNLDVFMGQMQVQFDSILLQTGHMQKRFSELQDELKENAQLLERTEKDREASENNYNEMYAVYNETVQEKEKLIHELTNFNGQLTHNIKENIKLKKEISDLEDQLNEVKNANVEKDSELQEMITYAKKLQSNMEYQFAELRKNSETNEINKLSELEDRYTIQIKRYENKILENERVINEFSELVKNYETQMEEYAQDIETKQEYIEDLTLSQDKLNQMIVEMEENMKKNKDPKTPSRRSTTHTSNQWRGTSTLESLDDADLKEGEETNLLSTQRKISMALDEKEVAYKKSLTDMEINLQCHREEIERLEQENEQFKEKVDVAKQYEEQMRQKITHYKHRMKETKEEGAKVKKHFKQLELYMSHWLNLIYLQSLLISTSESDSLMCSSFSPETNQDILYSATNRIRRAFQTIPAHERFIEDILSSVESSVSSISFDPKAVELAKMYSRQSQIKLCIQHNKSNDTTSSSRQGQLNPLSLGSTPLVSECGGRGSYKVKSYTLTDSGEPSEEKKTLKVGSDAMNRLGTTKKFALVKKTIINRLLELFVESFLDEMLMRSCYCL